MYKQFLFFLTALLTFLIVSCNESTENNSIKNNPYPKFTPPGGYSWDDILQKYNQTNVLGYVKLERYDYKIYQGTDIGDTIPIDAIDIYANATFFDENYNYVDAGQFLFNGNQFIAFDIGEYSYDASLDEMDIYFDGTWNKFKNESPSDFPLFVDSVQFKAPINVTNIQRGDHISRSSDLTIQWTGINNDIVGIFLSSSPFQEQTDSTDLAELYNIVVDNNGSYTIPANKLTYFTRGFASLILTSYQPRFVTVSDGSKILVLGVSSQNITVIIDD
jgi:hypothetical protein